MWKAATAQEPEDLPNVQASSLYTSGEHAEALESFLPKHLLGANPKVAKLCRPDYSSSSSALFSTNSTNCTINMSDALSDSLFLELNALQSSHNANYEVTAGASGLGLLGGLAGAEPGQQAIGNTTLFGSNHEELSDLPTLSELDAWALMQQQAQQNEQAQEQVLVLQQGQLAELQRQLQNAQIQEAPLRQQQLHLQQQQQQLQLLQLQGGLQGNLQGGLLSLPAKTGQQPQSQQPQSQQVWLSSSLTQNNALLANFNNMQQQAVQQQQLLSGSAIQAQQQQVNNRAQVERLLASIAQTRGMSSTPLLPDQQQQLNSASAVLMGSKPSSSTASLPLGNNPMVTLSMPKGQPALISAPQLGAAPNINVQSLMVNGSVSRSMMNIQPNSLNPAAAAALQLAQMSPSASILAGSGGIGGVNTIQHRSKMPNLTQLQNAPVAIANSPTVANAGHASAVAAAAGLTMRPAALPRHPALGAANQRVLGTTVRAQPPSWAGADWNPRAAAASASTASAGTGVFLPQFQRPPSSGPNGDKSSPPTSGNTQQSPPASSDVSASKAANHNGSNNQNNSHVAHQDGSNTPTAAASGSNNSLSGGAVGTARLSASGSICEVGPAPTLLNAGQANAGNRPHAAQQTYAPILGANTGNLAVLQARLQAHNMLQQMQQQQQQQQQLQLQLQHQQAQQQLQQQALRMQQLSLQQDNSNSLRLHALQQDNNPGSGTLNWCVLQPADDLGLDGFVTTTHQS